VTEEQPSSEDRKETPDEEQKKKRLRLKSRFDSLKLDWTLPGGLTLGGTGVITLLTVLVGGLVILITTGTLHMGAPEYTRAEPVQTPGDNPFMPSVGIDQRGVSSPPRTGRTFVGSTSGLYGGTLNNSTCDRQAMAAFLQTHPSEGAAWAETQGINQADLSNYIFSLTPVFLRSDTSVTNHGFSNGHATTLHSILQAGTAVLVDRYGVPRARCYCGNPLTLPNPPAAEHYVGSTWPGFSPSSITTIKPAAAEITEFTLVNPSTNEIIYRPTGTAGDEDRTQTSPITDESGNPQLTPREVPVPGQPAPHDEPQPYQPQPHYQPQPQPQPHYQPQPQQPQGCPPGHYFFDGHCVERPG
jgi:hypothetical protein